jgi:thiamine pyrophosphate-dependent acetolactate synthase large subunit-like protein
VRNVPGRAARDDVQAFEQATGIKVVEAVGPSLAKIKAMVDSRNVEWDVSGITPGDLLVLAKNRMAEAALRSALPPDGVVASDMTQLAYTGNNAFATALPRTWLHTVGFGTLGYALPAAIGAKIAAPERAAVAIVGDLGLLYCVQELATAVELELPIVVVLWNNQGLGAIRKRFDQYGIRSNAADMKNPDFVALAHGFGCRAERPDSLARFERLVAEGLRANAPTVIELCEGAVYLAA